MHPGPGGNRGELLAWDPVKRAPAWKIKEDLPLWSGTLVTGGDVAFYGTMDGWFKAIDARNGSLLPVGVPVSISLRSQDVIHSFWVPNLHGKQDLIPGRDTNIHLLPERTGVFRGQCAEFCGAQHAHMAFDVFVESQEDFNRWSDAQRQLAAEPSSEQAIQGREIFMRSACVMCHSIKGTLASAGVAPDLTHVASRRSLAAGTLSNNIGNLAGWLADPQGVKPGAHMPYIGLSSQELTALVAYLGELK